MTYMIWHMTYDILNLLVLRKIMIWRCRHAQTTLICMVIHEKLGLLFLQKVANWIVIWHFLASEPLAVLLARLKMRAFNSHGSTEKFLSFLALWPLCSNRTIFIETPFGAPRASLLLLLHLANRIYSSFFMQPTKMQANRASKSGFADFNFS